MEEFLNIIGNQFFPIVIAVYLLLRTETKIDEMTDSIRELAVAIERKNF